MRRRSFWDHRDLGGLSCAPGFTRADRSRLRKEAFLALDLQPGDRVQYDFGLGKGKVRMTVVSVDADFVRTQDDAGHTYRFLGEGRSNPGIWEGDLPSVGAQLEKLEEFVR